MNRRLKKKKGFTSSLSFREIKKSIFNQMEKEALELEKHSEWVELPEEMAMSKLMTNKSPKGKE
ncbi:MAG: hypothetical protein HFJ10_08950 [Lachnospiraceae bacterium]|nr:hypothetical protein [Lachnospiraceae bacterium]